MEPGFRADLVLIDLTDPAYMPFNSAARQLVFSESGRGIRTAIVDGRVLVRDGKVTTVDETALRAELDDLLPAFRQRFDEVAALSRGAIPFLLEANRRLDSIVVGPDRFVRDT